MMARTGVWVPALMVLGAGLLLGLWSSAVLGGVSAVLVFSAPHGWRRYAGLLLTGCAWVVGGIVLALMRWQAGAVPGVVGAGLLVCVGVLALSETTSRPLGVGQAPEAAGVAVLGSADRGGAR